MSYNTPQLQFIGGRGVLAGRICFTAITLSESHPPLDEGLPAAAGVQSWHEDDWRQIELVHTADIPYLNQVFEEQHRFRQEHAGEHGFTGMYLRREHPTPIASLGIQVADVLALGGTSPEEGELYMGPTAGAFRVRQGHTVVVPQVGTLYFTATGSSVRQIGLFPQTCDVGPSNETLSAIHGFATKYSLALVDWYKLAGFYLQDIDSFIQWLGYEVPSHQEL